MEAAGDSELEARGLLLAVWLSGCHRRGAAGAGQAVEELLGHWGRHRASHLNCGAPVARPAAIATETNRLGRGGGARLHVGWAAPAQRAGLGRHRRWVPSPFCLGFVGTTLGAMFLSLPSELIVDILGLLPARDLAAALCSCASLSALGPHAWQRACQNRWPAWAAIAAEPEAQWRRQYELLSLREAEAGCLPSVAAVRRTQQSVTERHRAILTEWLCEVRGWGRAAAGGGLIPCMVAQQRLCRRPRRSPSTGISTARSCSRPWPTWTTSWSGRPWRPSPGARVPNVQVLQTAPRPAPLPNLPLPANHATPNCRPPPRRFQLLGLACLRAAMGDARKPSQLEEMETKLDAKNFAYISDDTYTASEVEAETQVRGGGPAAVATHIKLPALQPWPAAHMFQCRQCKLGRKSVVVRRRTRQPPAPRNRPPAARRRHRPPLSHPPSTLADHCGAGATPPEALPQCQDVPAQLLVPRHAAGGGARRRDAHLHAGEVRSGSGWRRHSMPRPSSPMCSWVDAHHPITMWHPTTWLVVACCGLQQPWLELPSKRAATAGGAPDSRGRAPRRPTDQQSPADPCRHHPLPPFLPAASCCSWRSWTLNAAGMRPH